MTGEGKGVVAGVMIAGMAAIAFFVGRTRLSELETPHAGNPIAAMSSEPRTWREMSRQRMIGEAFEFQNWKAWAATPHGAHAQLRASLTGRFNSTPAAEVAFVVMDATNFERLRAGYPPLILYTAEPAQPIYWAEPPGTSYAVVFLQRPNKDQRAEFPTSLSELALSLIRAGIVRPPARVTAEIDRVLECFCTTQEAGAGK